LWDFFPIKTPIFDENRVLIAKKTGFEEIVLISSVFTHCLLKN